MTNWGGILATVAGGGVAGAGEGWAKDIKSRKEDASEMRRQKAWETRQTNLEILRQKHNVENINLEDTLDRNRGTDEFNRKQTADETNYNRRQGEEELTFQRRLKEKLESEKQLIELKRGEVDSAMVNAQVKAIEMCKTIIDENKDNITPDIVAQINDIRKTAKLKPFDYRETGQTVKEGGFLGIGATDKPIMGFFPSEDEQGILSGGESVKQPKPNVGNVELDDLFTAVNKPPEDTTAKSSDVDTSDIASSEVFDVGGDSFDESKFQKWYSGYASKQKLNPDPDNPKHYYDYRAAYKSGAEPDSSGHMPSKFKKEGHPRMVLDGVNTKTGKPILASSKDVPYDVKMGEGPTKAQYDAAHQELIILAKKLGLESTIDLKNVTPGSEEFDMVISAAKKAGGVIWDQIKQLVNTLGQSQAEARKGLTAYK